MLLKVAGAAAIVNVKPPVNPLVSVATTTTVPAASGVRTPVLALILAKAGNVACDGVFATLQAYGAVPPVALNSALEPPATTCVADVDTVIVGVTTLNVVLSKIPPSAAVIVISPVTPKTLVNSPLTEGENVATVVLEDVHNTVSVIGFDV